MKDCDVTFYWLVLVNNVEFVPDVMCLAENWCVSTHRMVGWYLLMAQNENRLDDASKT